MPSHIYTEGLPEAPTPVPAWGSLPLGIYLLSVYFFLKPVTFPAISKLKRAHISQEQWATPHPDLPDELPD
jgi:hypothetical protein